MGYQIQPICDTSFWKALEAEITGFAVFFFFSNIFCQELLWHILAVL